MFFLADQPYHALLKEIRRRRKSNEFNESCDAAIFEMFTRDVFPEIAVDYKKTASTLRTRKQQHDLQHQLRETLIKATKLVLRNNRKEQCLSSPTINSLNHVYPLLLREILKWHELGIKHMKPKKLDSFCWSQNALEGCTAKVSFKSSLSPALWLPLSRFLKDNGAVCKENADSKKEEPSVSLCPEASSNWSNSPDQCKFFSSYNVTSLFLHANMTQNFLTFEEKPLRKKVEHNSRVSVVRGYLNLYVSSHDPFVISYNSTSEAVKITFHYLPVKTCTVKSLCQSCEECSQSMAGTLQWWFDSIRSYPDLIDTCSVTKRFDFGRQPHRRAPALCLPVHIRTCQPSAVVWDQMKTLGEEARAVLKGTPGSREYIMFDHEFDMFFHSDFCSDSKVLQITEPWHHNATGRQISIAVSPYQKFFIIRNSAKRYAKIKAHFVES